MDLSAMDSVLIGTVFIPVFLGIFKNELSKFFTDLNIYRNRMFDEDGDPGTGEDCYLQSGATGAWSKITIKEYQFSILPSKRKIITLQNSPERVNEIIIVPYSYNQWVNMIKGSLSKLPEDARGPLQRREIKPKEK